MTPTDEQAAARDVFAEGKSFVLQAGAGTGKTSTLKLLAETAPERKGLYLAFNAAIAAEARQKFPNNITVKTVHALAMQGTNFAFQPRLKSPRVPLHIAANRLGVFGDVMIGPGRRMRPTTQAALAMSTVRRFCNSADDKLKRRHVPHSPGLNPAQHKLVQHRILPLARKMWDDVSSPIGGNFRFEHDHYLKVWALTHPIWPADFVLYDEAQDSNPVVSSMVADQLGAGKQLVAVGDSAQGIYGWRGAVNAMDSFDVSITLPLTQSFRFGQAIADEANLWLELLGLPMRLTGRPDLASVVVPTVEVPDAVLCRTNGAAIGELFAALDENVKVGLVGGGQDLLAVAKAAIDLKEGRPTNHEEFALFSSWLDVKEYADSGDDPHLSTLVKVIEAHGAPAIIGAIEAAAHEQHADRTLSTLHKAKGREWGQVRLASDFAEPRKDENGKLALPSREERMVSYVAVTRAQDVLGIGNLGWAREWLDRPPAEGADLRSFDAVGDPQATPAAGSTTWTRKLDQALRSQYAAGTSLPLLATTFGCSPDEVLARLAFLGGPNDGTDGDPTPAAVH
ncbi:UvrD-helicase domain-containing protein [Nocardioides ultimimeridianus]